MSGKGLSISSRFLLGLMAAVLLLPVYGSWVDYRYAERQPAHRHIYLGKIDLDHHRTSESKDVVSLPDQDATGQPVVLLSMPEGQLISVSAETGNLTFGLSDEYLSPDDAFLPPPDHPPRI